MLTADLDRLREIAARPEEDNEAAAYEPDSNARMRAAAQAAITHSERFATGYADDPAISAIASVIADLLVLADLLEPRQEIDANDVPLLIRHGGARTALDQAMNYIAESGLDTSLNGAHR